MNSTVESSVYVLRYLLIVFISLLILYFGRNLFIPFAGILKIMTDHTEEWKALNVLLKR
jgi:hypothetical protein